MRRLDQVGFLINLLEAATRYEKLPKEGQSVEMAKVIAYDVGLAPKRNGVGADIIVAIQFFSRSGFYQEQGISQNVLLLSARLAEKKAWRAYQRDYADRAA